MQTNYFCKRFNMLFCRYRYYYYYQNMTVVPTQSITQHILVTSQLYFNIFIRYLLV